MGHHDDAELAARRARRGEWFRDWEKQWRDAWASHAGSKARILESAARLFGEKGYAATSMRDIAVAAEMTPSNIYNHFASKEDMLFECWRINGEINLGALAEIVASPAPARERLELAICSFISFLDNHILRTRMAEERRWVTDPEKQARLQTDRDTLQHYLEILVAECRGEASPLDVFMAATAIHQFVLSIRKWHTPACPYTLDDIVEYLVDYGAGTRS
jgi:AcrR family transcriptional regulator